MLSLEKATQTAVSVGRRLRQRQLSWFRLLEALDCASERSWQQIRQQDRGRENDGEHICGARLLLPKKQRQTGTRPKDGDVQHAIDAARAVRNKRDQQYDAHTQGNVRRRRFHARAYVAQLAGQILLMALQAPIKAGQPGAHLAGPQNPRNSPRSSQPRIQAAPLGHKRREPGTHRWRRWRRPGPSSGVSIPRLSQ